MVMTRKMAKARKNKTIKNNATLPRLANTLHGVHEWHKKMFEKLGWMVLAKAKGYTEKVALYKKSIGYLIETIDHIMSEYEDHNRKHDLAVLKMNAKCLHNFVSKHL